MPICSSRMNIRIQPVFLILAAAMLLVVPIRWIFGCMLASGVHELGHYIMLKLCRVPVYGITVGSRGTVMDTGAMTERVELLCAAAGPAAGLLTLIVARWFPTAAVCAYLQSIYNLLPIGDSDGGRILSCISRLLFPGRIAEKIVAVVEYAVTAALICLGFHSGIALHLGLLPFIGGALLLFRCLKAKIPCKDWKQRVQYTKRKWKGKQL